jgi:hypothetical protein
MEKSRILSKLELKKIIILKNEMYDSIQFLEVALILEFFYSHLWSEADWDQKASGCNHSYKKIQKVLKLLQKASFLTFSMGPMSHCYYGQSACACGCGLTKSFKDAIVHQSARA